MGLVQVWERNKGFWKMALGDLLADGLGVLLAFFHWRV